MPSITVPAIPNAPTTQNPTAASHRTPRLSKPLSSQRPPAPTPSATESPAAPRVRPARAINAAHQRLPTTLPPHCAVVPVPAAPPLDSIPPLPKQSRLIRRPQPVAHADTRNHHPDFPCLGTHRGRW